MYDEAIADNDDRGDWLHFSTNRFKVIQDVWSSQNSTRLLTAQWTHSSHYHWFACLIWSSGLIMETQIKSEQYPTAHSTVHWTDSSHYHVFVWFEAKALAMKSIIVRSQWTIVVFRFNFWNALFSKNGPYFFLTHKQVNPSPTKKLFVYVYQNFKQFNLYVFAWLCINVISVLHNWGEAKNILQMCINEVEIY